MLDLHRILLSRLWSDIIVLTLDVRYRLFDFGLSLSSIRIRSFVLFCSASVIHSFSMSTHDCRSVRHSSEDHPFRRKDVLIQPSCQGRNFYAGDADGSASSPVGTPLSGNSVVAPVNVTEYVNRFWSFLDALWLAAMHQDGDRFKFIDARYGGRHETALRACKKRRIVFHRKAALYLSSGEVQLDMLYIRCAEERK